eukprot:TRINITY_DN11487_c0_g1_i5.p1 TRINITY_DN11487_c0_g1~~TRINITY_DN11487_c0_g1_i5.p1  ORF type:complete len:610 (-),score=121.66 TRINITY_DN11487_c0_g1_i5:41-1870(-)
MDLSQPPSPLWLAEVERFCVQTKEWDSRNSQISASITKCSKLNGEHFSAGQEFVGLIVNQVEHSPLGSCSSVKQACERLVEVFECVHDEGAMLIQSHAAIWDQSCDTAFTSLKQKELEYDHSKGALHDTLRSYLDTLGGKETAQDAGTQMQVSDMIDAKRDSWAEIEDATLAYQTASCALNAEVGAAAHQHSKTTLERLCSTVSSLTGFHCMVGEMMKSLQPSINEFKISLTNARAARESAVRRQQRFTAELLAQVRSGFASERQHSIEHNQRESNTIEAIVSNHSITDKVNAGYVFQDMGKGSKHNWCLVWLVLDNGVLWVIPADKESSKQAKKKKPVRSPMAVATVKVPREVPFSFEVITPQWQFLFQSFGALSQARWVSCLRNATADCLYGSESAKNETQVSTKQLELLWAATGNTACCDCGSPDPEWISINLGVLFCIECSGIHRSLGAHLSKVRGLKLDTLPEDTTSMLCSIGNLAANSYWEASLDCATNQPAKPQPTDSRDVKGDFIRAKYVDRAYMQEKYKLMHDLRSGPVECMFQAVKDDDTTALAVVLALVGGDGGVMLEGTCLLYTSDAADEEDSVDLGGRRIIKKKKKNKRKRSLEVY